MLFKKIKGIRVNEDEDFRIYLIDFDQIFDYVTLRNVTFIQMYLSLYPFKWIYPKFVRLEFILYEFNDSLVSCNSSIAWNEIAATPFIGPKLQ